MGNEVSVQGTEWRGRADQGTTASTRLRKSPGEPAVSCGCNRDQQKWFGEAWRVKKSCRDVAIIANLVICSALP
jgi:hypothetical protein